MNKKVFLLHLCAFLLRGASFLTGRGMILLLIVIVLLSPLSPALLWEYEYNQIGSERAYTRCTYLGFRGLVTPDMRGDCPSIMMLNANDFSPQP